MARWTVKGTKFYKIKYAHNNINNTNCTDAYLIKLIIKFSFKLEILFIYLRCCQIIIIFLNKLEIRNSFANRLNAQLKTSNKKM